MRPEPVIVQQPGTAGPLFLLFHGVGATAEGLVPLGRFLGAHFPAATVVSVPAAFESDLGAGRQWFSVRGVTEENRGARVAAALPLFVDAVQQLQQRFGFGPDQTALVGFSQGAIMSLESARHGHRLAARIVSIAGRFAELPGEALQGTSLHLIHGEEDTVVPALHTRQAHERIASLGGDVTADLLPGRGHEIDQGIGDRMIDRLKHHVPQTLWNAASGGQNASEH